MAVELESSNVSPRISFSLEFWHSDFIPEEQQQPPFRSISNSTVIDFDFCVCKSFDDQQSSSADELFSNGMILPAEIKQHQQQQKKKNVNPVQATLQLTKNPDCNNKIVRDGAGGDDDDDDDDDLEENINNDNDNIKRSSSKSFWKFRRSRSLNFCSGYGRILCPLPPLLSRSNSTYAASNDNKGAILSKDGSNKSSSSSRNKSSYLKPLWKKNYGYYGNGVHHVNPVLNVPSGNLFGLGSIFGKDKNNKKRMIRNSNRLSI